jgi:hypothetical protein
MDSQPQSNGKHGPVYLQHLGIMCFGLPLGLALAHVALFIPFDLSSELIKARELGITSITILEGYPKTKDLLTFLFVLGLPAATTLLPWLVLMRGRRRQLLKEVLDTGEEEPRSKTRGWRASLLLVVLAAAYLCLDLTRLHTPGFNPHVGAWILLGEEGENLAWVQSILSGGVFGRDFFCLYGPMLIYPLAFAMKLFGETVVVERSYAVFLNVLAYSIVILFLYRTLRWKVAFVVFSLAYLFIFSPQCFVSPNTSYLRMVLGILPVLLGYLYLRRRENRFLLLLAGAVAGQSLLFSQEAGLCSLVALSAFFLPWWLARRDWRESAKEAALIGGGCALSLAPLLTYFAAKGALSPLLDSLYRYPRFVMLGYGGLPLPSFSDFIAAPLAPAHLYYYWILLFYLAALVTLVPRLFLGLADRRTLLSFAILIFGILLYRLALGRSNLANMHKVAHPAFLLAFLFLDRAITSVVDGKRVAVARLASLFVGILIFISSSYIVLSTPHVYKAHLSRTFRSALNPMMKIKVVQQGPDVPDIERGGVYYDGHTAASLKRIHGFLNRNTQAGDYVYFFPNEAAYYFLFDRNNPTRYAISYFAITREQRKELVADLEAKEPKYVVYSLKTWRVDDIPEVLQVPEVVSYINSSYRVDVQLDDVVIMKRIGT